MVTPQKNSQNLLILGCGDIGQRLARQLAPQGYDCIGVRRTATANLPHLRYQVADTTRAGSLNELLAQGPDVILISMTPSERSDAGYAQAYGGSCRELLAGLSHTNQRPRLLVFVSSTSVYAQGDGNWVDETSACLPNSYSGQRLLEAEQLIRNSGHAFCIVRPSGIYGPGRQRLLEQVRRGQRSSSAAYTNRIHAEDLAGALAHLIERSRHQPIDNLYLATDSAPTPLADVMAWLAQQLAIDTPASLHTHAERSNKRISNQRLLNSGFKLRYADYRQGYAELLHQPS